MGDISIFLGNQIEIDRSKRTLFIHQSKYTYKIIRQYSKQDLYGVITPFELGIKLVKSKLQVSQQEIKRF